MATPIHRPQIQEIKLWDAAHWWHGQEPTVWQESLLPQEIRDTFSILREAVDSGKLSLVPESHAARRHHSTPLRSRKVYRRELAVFAESIGERPAFLFDEHLSRSDSQNADVTAAEREGQSKCDAPTQPAHRAGKVGPAKTALRMLYPPDGLRGPDVREKAALDALRSHMNDSTLSESTMKRAHRELKSEKGLKV